MVTNELIVVRVIRKERDHCDGTPLMRYTFKVVYDPRQEGRNGEIINKYYAVDPYLITGKTYAIGGIDPC